MCDLSEDSNLDVSRKSTHRARKEYGCSTCRGPIAVGERYVYCFLVVDGSPSVERSCLACDEAREEFGRAHNWWPTPSYFEECLRGCISEGDEESDARWAPMLAAIEARNPGREAPRG